MALSSQEKELVGSKPGSRHGFAKRDVRICMGLGDMVPPQEIYLRLHVA